MARKSGLGKGLDALFVDNSTDHANGVVTLRISEIEPDKNQPRKDFDENALTQLADSIAEHGGASAAAGSSHDKWRISAGRGRTALESQQNGRLERGAGGSTGKLPTPRQWKSDSIENLQREDLNPIEEALGYRELIDSHQMTQDMVAQRVGKSRPVVANALRLLNLPDGVVKMVRNGVLSAGHARALLSIEDPEEQNSMAKKAADGLLTVRDIENVRQKEQSAG